ncbi:MAG: hypothetical protein ABIE84_04000 [bacterium]
MRFLIAYYSRSGNNKKLALELAKHLSCDSEEIIDLTNRQGWLGIIGAGMAGALKKETKIKEPEKSPDLYDGLIICSPHWAGNLPPAPRVYLKKFAPQIKNIVFCSVCAGGDDGGNNQSVKEIEQITHKKHIIKMLIKTANFKKDNYQQDVEKILSTLRAGFGHLKGGAL